MKVRMKIRTLLLAVCLVATMMPAYTGAAFADTTDPAVKLTIGTSSTPESHTLTSGAITCTSSALSGGSITATINGNTVNLVLDSVKISAGAIDTSGLKIELENFKGISDLDIEVKGDNTITAGGIGLELVTNTKIHGDGTLDLVSNGENKSALYCSENLTIEETTVNATATGGWSSGIKGSTVTINGGTVNATATGGWSNGINGSTVTINGGAVTATAEATGGWSRGISSDDSVTINGGVVTATAEAPKDWSFGIYGSRVITINGGIVTATAEATGGWSHGFYCSRVVTINGGIITATAEATGGWSYGFYCSAVTIKGGAVYTIGAGGALMGTVADVLNYRGSALYQYVSIITKHKETTNTPVCVYQGNIAPTPDLSVGLIPAYGTVEWENISTGSGITYGDYSSMGAYTWNYEVTSDSSITLTGQDLKINSSYHSATRAGIYCGANLKLRGSISVGDSISVTPDNFFGIYSSKNMTIDGATVNATGKNGGISSLESIVISGGAVTAKATGENGSGILANSTTISGGEINAIGKGTGGNGIGVPSIHISGGTIYAAGGASAMFNAPTINYSNGRAEVLASTTASGALDTEYVSEKYDTYKQIKIQKYQPPTKQPSKPTVSTVTDNEGEAGGTTEYDSTTKILTITPAEGFVIEDVLVNGKSVGTKTELSSVYGWDDIQVKFVKDTNAKISKGVKATTLKTATIKSYKYKGKNRIKLVWEKSKGFKVDFYRIYRATGNGEFKMFYTTKTNKCSYVNTKNVLTGVKYKFKIVGVRIIDGKEVTTQTSKWRSALGK